MNYDLQNMCNWEREKAMFLINTAQNLGIDLNSEGEISVNKYSGYTYLWSENHNFSLAMNRNCELKKEDIMIIWSNPENGNEEEEPLNNKTLQEIEEYCNEIEHDLKN